MEKVVYILGAGFSAPLGLPVMDNFYSKSKDMYLNDLEKYSYFKDVIKKIDELSKIKNYYKTDLFNIEEILSILEMERHASGKKTHKDIIKYIKHVIIHHTPQENEIFSTLYKHEDILFLNNWQELIFGNNLWKLYGMFFSNLQNLKFQPTQNFSNSDQSRSHIICKTNEDTFFKYSIITLNYDLIPEIFCNILNEYFNKEGGQQFYWEKEYKKDDIVWSVPYLAKLHGCITSTIIPPTWNKSASKKIVSAWKIAYKLLSDANHIRILGYSLPITDSYVKYLLKSAVLQAENLKSIDILCIDNDGSVKKRYEEFIEFKNKRFRNKDLNLYLENIYKYNVIKNQLRENKQFVLDKLEEAHEAFFSSD